MFLRSIFAVWALALAGCASGYDDLAALEHTPGWSVRVFTDLPAPSLAAYRFVPGSHELWVYIEGDGRAWITPRQISNDPTPDHPIALKMAKTQQAASVLYLGRACQYLQRFSSPCENRFWSLDRYGPEAILQLAHVIDSYAVTANASRIVLVGYSGGGVMAALLAAERSDVSALITVAANMSLSSWVAHHKITALTGSIDPVTKVAVLSAIPQVHFAGLRDKVVPPKIVDDYLSHLPSRQFVHVKIVPDFDHGCCWADSWPLLRDEAVAIIDKLHTPVWPSRETP